MRPIGRQCASGLSLLLLATRCRCSSAAHGWNGRPSLNDEPIFQKGLLLTIFRKSSLVANVLKFGPAAGRAPAGAGARELSHMPLRSGLPSAVLGAGALRFGLPSGVLGTPGVG